MITPMDFSSLMRKSWYITIGHWRLWLLTAAMSISFIPAFVVGASFANIAAVLTFPMQGELARLLAPLRDIPVGTWLLLAALSLAITVISTAVSCALQAAVMRASAACATGNPLSLTGALRLGRRRFVNILKLSIFYGFLIAIMALIPPLMLLLLPDDSLVNTLSGSLGTTLGPINSVLGVFILLALMSIALEDVRAEAAAERTWKVFKAGWKEFLVVTGISLGTGIIQALLLVPFLVLLILAVLMQEGWIYVLLCGLISLPLVLLTWLGTGVYAMVLYTLVYRAAANITPTMTFEPLQR
jgi:hypothetical protein